MNIPITDSNNCLCHPIKGSKVFLLKIKTKLINYTSHIVLSLIRLIETQLSGSYVISDNIYQRHAPRWQNKMTDIIAINNLSTPIPILSNSVKNVSSLFLSFKIFNILIIFVSFRS